MKMSYAFDVWITAFVWLLSIGPSMALPPGFVDEGFANVNAPTGFSFVPKLSGDGYMMFVAEKGGRVWLLTNPDESDDELRILDYRDRVCSNAERGIQSVVPHPDFLTNRYVYVFYTFPKFGNCGTLDENGPVNRVARFTMQDNFMLDTDSEEIILETSSLYGNIHNGGDMQFGKDGYLYISLGDAGDRRTNAQALDRLLGSILRITADGGIPADNPFTAQNGYNSARCAETGLAPSGSVCEEIFAYGVRNPFRFAMDPNTPEGVVRLFFNDVGGNAWEETSELVSGGNFGWPIREGPCQLDSTTSCDPTGDEFLDPVYWYVHTDDGGAAVGCDFVPNGLWPAEYDNTFLYMDFVFEEIYVLREDPSLACRTCDLPVPGWSRTVFHSWEAPVDMAFGPFKGGQALYYSVRGVGYNNIRRIYFLGGDNEAPLAVLESANTQGSVGESIEFDGSGSSDPNFDEITFNWDFGDGTTIEDGPAIISHEFSSGGQYTVTLTVTDAFGFSNVVFIEVAIGEKPSVSIISPPEGTVFAVGDIFTLIGSAVDCSGESIPDASLTWEVRQHHNTHYHPFLDLTSGNNIEISPAPPPEDFLASTNSFLEVRLTATDADGLSETVSRTIMPITVILEFDTEPSGLELVLDDFPVVTPIEVVSWENHQLKAEAQDQPPWFWMSWSDDGSRRHAISVPAPNEGLSGQDAADYQFLATFGMFPSERPSLFPTLQPSCPPTTSAEPTEQPVETPTSAPVTSEQPAMQPSSVQPNLQQSTPPTSVAPSETASRGSKAVAFLPPVFGSIVALLLQI